MPVLTLVVPDETVSELERKLMMMKAAPVLTDAMLDILAATADPRASPAMQVQRVQQIAATALASLGAPAQDCSICRRTHGAEVRHERE